MGRGDVWIHSGEIPVSFGPISAIIHQFENPLQKRRMQPSPDFDLDARIPNVDLKFFIAAPPRIVAVLCGDPGDVLHFKVTCLTVETTPCKDENVDVKTLFLKTTFC